MRTTDGRRWKRWSSGDSRDERVRSRNYPALVYPVHAYMHPLNRLLQLRGGKSHHPNATKTNLKTPDEGRVDDIDKPPPLAPLHRSSPLPSAASTRGHFPPPQASHSALRRLPDHTHQNSWRSRLRMEGGGRIRRWRRRILGRR